MVERLCWRFGPKITKINFSHLEEILNLDHPDQNLIWQWNTLQRSESCGEKWEAGFTEMSTVNKKSYHLTNIFLKSVNLWVWPPSAGTFPYYYGIFSQHIYLFLLHIYLTISSFIIPEVCCWSRPVPGTRKSLGISNFLGLIALRFWRHPFINKWV